MHLYPSFKYPKFIIAFSLLLFLQIFYNIVYSEEADEPDTEKIGNFSLPGSQQPTPITSFGDDIVDKGVLQFFLFADAIIGPGNYRTDIIPGLLYGITDDFSIYFNIPFSPKSKEGPKKSSGLDDFFIQLEYAFYSKDEKYSSTQATIVGSVFLPTGSNKKIPRTGFGSSSFLIGSTLNHTTVCWIFTGGIGGVLTTKFDGYKAGKQFLYQASIGRNLYTPPGWIFAAFLEFAGQYSQKNIVNHHKDSNSGGNVIFMIPSLWLSSEKLILQLGIGCPIFQHLFGNQFKQRISYNFSFGWTF